ncbi:MAG: alpha-2-macroglobulin [Burkholderiaceae bacterium]|nr:alpha-2-macroglobulin [Burkholderiaceae bacterium]
MSEQASGGSRIWGGIGRAASSLLGTWSAPPWLRWSGAKLHAAGSASVSTVKSRPRTSAGVLAAVLAAGVGGYYGYAWWQARPKPIEVSFAVTNPPLTDFLNNGTAQPLSVKFSKSVAPLALVGKEVQAGIVATPAIDGSWRWAADDRLEFTPKQEWPVGAEVKVVLDRQAVAPQVRLAQYEFAYASAAFVPTVRKAEFYQDPVNPALKKAVFELGFSHPVNPAELEKRIELQLAGQAAGVLGVGRETTKFTVSYDKLKLSAYVHSAALPIPKESTTLNLTVDKGLVAQAGGPATKEVLAKAVAVPGLYSLALGEVVAKVVTNERYEPEQVLLVNVSQPVHEREVAKNISAWVLPVFRPGAKKDEQELGPYAWPDPAEITDAVLKQSTKLELTPVAAEREHTELHSFKIRADVGRVIYVQLEPKAKSFGGYRMRERGQRLVKVPPFPPELRILSQGALLPMSGEKKVAVLVRDLPGLRIELGRVQPSQLQHLVSQAQGSFTNPEFYGSFGPDNMTERFERKQPLPQLQRGKPHYEAIDLSEYLAKDGEQKRGLFLLKVQGYDPKAEDGSRAVPARTEPEEGEGEGAGGDQGEAAPQDGTDPASMEQSRLLLVTDLGLLIKQSTDGSRDVFVQSIYTGLPLAGVTVEVMAKNGSILFSQLTDAGGRAHFDKLEGLTRERAPLLVLARKAGDMSFMPLNRYDRQLDYSRFDVGGMPNARTQDQLSAYLFSDRGIYRPGETMKIGLIVKAADWARPLAGVPLEAEVLDARGLTVKRERLRLAAGGFAELSHTTLETSPTGNYTVNLNIIGKEGRVERQIGTVTVKVQEFLPDRMKVTAQLSSPAVEGWVNPKDLKGRINAQNLFGTPAENRRVEASMTLQPAWPAFRSHADYQFYDPQRAKEGFTDELPAGQTDVNGDAEFDLRLQRFAKATYRLSLLAKVFEPEGGRSVAAETSALVSEQAFLIGVKHDGDLGFVSRGSQRFSHLIAIDPAAKKTAMQDLTLQFVERKVVSVLMRQPNDTYRYESRKKESVISESALAIPAAGHKLALDTAKAGNYSYVLRDASGTELNRIDYSVAGAGNVTRSLERNAELQLTLSKKDYAPGEDIEISIRAPYVGAGLITIERDKIYAQQWFKTTTTASVQKIKLPKDFEGNGYVNVQFVRDPASDEIFMSPLSYGVVPFATSLAQRTNNLKLTVPELTKPGQVLKIKLAAEKPTRAVVFAIDEGILQVARYQTADPLGFFFQKRALEVRSTQILDLILPEFKRLMAASAPGGDDAGANARQLNPFKRKGEAPAVYWSGIVDVNGEKEFSYPVPGHFNGTLRVMAVAVNDTAIGVAQTKALVRGDFVLSPNLPLMVTPGDQFEVSVGVANNVTGAPKDAPVLLAIKPAATLELVGADNQTLKISPMREGVARFKLKVRDAAAAKLGSATLEFTASWNGKTATRRMDISVRPATPMATTLSIGSFSGSKDVDTPRNLVPEFRKQEVALSVLPLALAPGLMTYLDHFEHACTEQLVSRSLPALALAKRPEFAQDRPPQNAASSLQQTLNVLRTRQNAQGGFGLWAASVQADEYASVYAVHLMLEARELDVPGATVPADMLNKGLEYLQQLAASNPADLNAARQRAYAIYLLTRNGAVTTPLLAGLRETLDAKHAKEWKLDATAAYLAATYQLLKQEKPAAELIAPLAKQVEQGGPVYRYAYYNDPTIRDAQTLYLLARHFPARLKGLDAKAYARFVAPLASGGYNTVSSAWTVLAFDAMARTLGEQALGKLAVVQLDAKGVAAPLALPANLLPRAAFLPGTAKLKLSNDSGLTSYYAVTQTGYDAVPPTQELKSGLEVVREYVGADGKPVTRVLVGDEVTVRLSLRGMPMTSASGAGSATVSSVALTDLLPGGFEPVQGRDANGAPSTVAGPNLEFADVREDRVVIYSWADDKVQTYTYKIRATNVGEFVVPPAFAQSMYERERQARSLAGRMVVVGK